LDLRLPVESPYAEDSSEQSSSAAMSESSSLRSGRNFNATEAETRNLYLTEPFFFDDGTRVHEHFFLNDIFAVFNV
jgi:hypothetical protein